MAKKTDKALRKIDISGQNKEVSLQYNVTSIPHFIIYDKDGKKTEGNEARKIIDTWLK